MTIHRVRGMTIVETMLVLAIVSVIILMGFKQIQTYRKDNYYTTLKYNVDILFQGLNQYYQANCATQGNRLWPTKGTPYASFSLDAATLAPYLPGPWPIYTPVVAVDSETGSTASSFYAQYNPMIKDPTTELTVEKNEYACFNFSNPRDPQSVSCSAPQPIKNTIVVMWQSQVVVKMADPKDAIYYVGMVGATCAADTYDPETAIDCTQNQDLEEATYLVWQRLPSFPSADVVSSHWVANPVSKLFKLQYTNDPMYELYTPNVTSTTNNTVYYRNYLCGG